jgi:hypothetical protein
MLHINIVIQPDVERGLACLEMLLLQPNYVFSEPLQGYLVHQSKWEPDETAVFMMMIFETAKVEYGWTTLEVFEWALQFEQVLLCYQIADKFLQTPRDYVTREWLIPKTIKACKKAALKEETNSWQMKLHNYIYQENNKAVVR